jgi:hypothetical protein
VDEQIEYSGAGATEWSVESSSVETMGHEAVDVVLRSLDGLDDRPVEEHVAVFEAAHEGLRAALAGAGEAAGRPGGPSPR